MSMPSADRAAVMVVRLWVEGNRETGLRARITQTLDTTGTERSLAVAASADDICDAVKLWVDAFNDPGQRDAQGDVVASDRS